MLDPILNEQLAYYRARAGEYDQWWLREGRYDQGPAQREQWQQEIAVLDAALAAFAPRGRTLELAGGTGIWTARLAPHATSLTVVDASPEVLAINRARLGAPDHVEYVEADLFAWEPSDRYDVVFFGFWLSHVPPDQFEAFWSKLRRALAPGGRVFLVDTLTPGGTGRDHEATPEHPIAVRELNDGRSFQIYKLFYAPAALTQRLAELGWRGDMRGTERYFLYGSAEPNTSD